VLLPRHVMCRLQFLPPALHLSPTAHVQKTLLLLLLLQVAGLLQQRAQHQHRPAQVLLHLLLLQLLGPVLTCLSLVWTMTCVLWVLCCWKQQTCQRQLLGLMQGLTVLPKMLLLLLTLLPALQHA